MTISNHTILIFQIPFLFLFQFHHFTEWLFTVSMNVEIWPSLTALSMVNTNSIARVMNVEGLHYDWNFPVIGGLGNWPEERTGFYESVFLNLFGCDILVVVYISLCEVFMSDYFQWVISMCFIEHIVCLNFSERESLCFLITTGCGLHGFC